MSPVVNPAAYIPYEIASDIEYAERRLGSFEKWAFNDHKRAARGIIDAVEAYGRAWGKLLGTKEFSMDPCRPYDIRILKPFSCLSEPLPADSIVTQAVEVASAFAELEANPLASLKGIDKQTLHTEIARQGRLLRMVKELGDLVRDRVQEDYVRLQPGDWVRVSYWHVVGRVSAVVHCRARVTTDPRRSDMSRIHTNHSYTTWDLVQQTLEKTSPPVPFPLCVPGLEWFHKASDAQRELDLRYYLQWSNLLELYNHVQLLEFAIEMMFRSEQPHDVMSSCIQRRHTFPEEYSNYFPDWIEGRLRTHYEFAGQLGEMQRKQVPRPNLPNWEEPPEVVKALVELGREMIDFLALCIADRVGREIGAQVRVDSNCVTALAEDLVVAESENSFDTDDDDELDIDDEYMGSYEGESATLINQSGRTLTVEFDPDVKLPGLHEIDISAIKAS